MEDRLHRKGRAGWRSIFTWAGVLALVAIAFFAFAACGDDDDDGDGDGDGEPTATEEVAGDGDGDGDGDGGLLQEAIDQGFLTVGISGEAPYGFEDADGNPTGEAPTVARAVLAELGIPEIDAVVVDFGSLIPGLQAGQFDMIAAGMFITPDRVFNENVLFSDPDYCAVQAFAVAEGNPLGIEPSFESLADSGASVGGLTGAVEVAGGETDRGYVGEAGIPEDRVEVFGQTPDLFDALEDGRIDAVALTSVTVNWEASQREGIEATEGFVYVDPEGNEVFGCGGFGFRQENQDFRDAFNDVLVEMRETDEILPLIQEFGFTAAETDQAKGVTVEDLVGEAPE